MWQACRVAHAVLGLSQTDEARPIRLRKEIGLVCHRSGILKSRQTAKYPGCSSAERTAVVGFPCLRLLVHEIAHAHGGPSTESDLRTTQVGWL